MDQTSAQAALLKDARIQKGDDLMEPVWSPPVVTLGHIRALRRHPLTGAVEVDRRAVYTYRGKRYVEARLTSIVETLGKMTAERQEDIERLMMPEGTSPQPVNAAAGPKVALRATRVVRLKK